MAPLLAVLWMVLKRHQDLELYDKSSCFLSYRDCYVVGKDPFDPFGLSLTMAAIVGMQLLLCQLY